jgi:orotate phosphoribosyltransferase
MEAVQVVRELGAEPVMILVVVDRGGSCAALAEAAGIEFRALVTAPELGFNYEGA